MAKLFIQLLGPFQVSKDGEILEGFSSNKVRALLAYLAVKPNIPHRRETLAALLWPESTDRAARTNLRSALANVRRIIEHAGLSTDLIHATPQSISLCLDDEIVVDAQNIESLIQLAVEGGDPSILEGEIAFPPGEFLQGFSIKGSPAFEDWVRSQRDHIHRITVNAYQRFIANALEQRQFERAISLSTQWLDVEPWNEEAHRELMKAQALSGQRGLAVAQFERCKEILTQELGVHPSTETVELYQLISDEHADHSVLALPTKAVQGYQLIHLIGEGRLGSVYHAFQPSTGREVAIKMFPAKIADQPAFIRQFEHDAHLIARLEHPHIIPIYDFWRDPGGAYMVMRRLLGGSLQTALEKGVWEIPRVVMLIEQIADALSAAHQQGIFHGNIKPSNILLDEGGQAYLSDFGIAHQFYLRKKERRTHDRDHRSQYRAPELDQGEPITPCAEVFSLGVLMLQLLLATPTSGDDRRAGSPGLETWQEDPQLGSYRPDVPDGMDRILSKAIAPTVEDRYPTPAAFAHDLRELNLPAIFPSAALPIKNPYKGLRPFQEADALDFFGREQLIETLLERMQVDDDLAHFLALVGPSGSGKSSIVRAGLIPALRRGGVDGSEGWYIVALTPGDDIFASLEAALQRIAVIPPGELIGQMKSGESDLHHVFHSSLPDQQSTMLLVIDQFEELFLQVDESGVDFFMRGLVDAMLQMGSRLRVIVTLRADFYDRPLQHPQLGHLFQYHTLSVIPLSEAELAKAITAPAERVGVEVEPGLVEVIQRDVRDHLGALPLVQFALTETFDRRIDRTLCIKAYTESGGVLGALSDRAESLYQSLDPAGKETARQVFLRLVNLDESLTASTQSVPSRRRVPRAELISLQVVRPDVEVSNSSAVETILEEYGTYRLLTFDHDPRTREPVVELAHEALMQAWGRLAEWITESREDILMHRRLHTAAREWQQANNSTDYLLRGSRLEMFSSWSETTSLILTEEDRTYLKESIKAAEERAFQESLRVEKEKRLERRTNRAWRILAIVLLTATVVSIGLAALAWNSQSRARSEAEARTAQQSIAEQQARIAAARELAMAALRNVDRDPELSILLAMQAMDKTKLVDDFVLPEAENALHQAVQAQRVELNIQLPYSMPLVIDYSPDGHRLLTGGAYGVPWQQEAHIWDVSTGELESSLPGILQDHEWLGNRNIATFDILEQEVQFWDPASARIVATYPALNVGESVTGMYGSMSPDGHLNAVSFSDGITRVWQVKEVETILSLPSPDGNPHTAVEFSHDGNLLALGGNDGSIEVFDVVSGKLLHHLQEHSHGVYDLVFDKSSSNLISVSGDSTGIIWDLGNGELKSRLAAHSNELFAVAMDEDESLVATAGWDRRIILWDFPASLASGVGIPVMTLSGHGDLIEDVSFSPDGHHLVSVAMDGSARIWNIGPGGGGEGPVFVNPTAPGPAQAVAIAIDPTGSVLGFANSDQTPKLWDRSTGEMLKVLQGHRAPVEVIEFDPSGQLAATLDLSGEIRFFDLKTGTPRGRMPTFNCGSYEIVSCDLDFSPDGQQIAVGDSRGEIFIFTLAGMDSGEEISYDLDLQWTAHAGSIFDLEFNPDCSTLASVSWDTKAKVWDVQRGQELLSIDHPLPVYGVTFSPEGDRLATSSQDAILRIWDLSSSELLAMMKGHSSSVFRSAFSPDGKRIASASYDGTVKVWDTGNGQELMSLEGHTNGVSDVAYSLDGSMLYSASVDGTVRSYILSLDELIALANSRVSRDLTETECRRYLHIQTCP